MVDPFVTYTALQLFTPSIDFTNSMFVVDIYKFGEETRVVMVNGVMMRIFFFLSSIYCFNLSVIIELPIHSELSIKIKEVHE